MAIIGPEPSDDHPSHHERHPKLNAHQRSDQRVSQKLQQGSSQTKTSPSQQDGWGRIWSTSPSFLHCCQKETTPTRQSSSGHAKEETGPKKPA